VTQLELATTLSGAAMAGDVKTAAALLDHYTRFPLNATQFVFSVKKFKATLLGVAVISKQAAFAAFLIKRGADPNIPCRSNGVKPLLAACENHDSAMVRVLIEGGARVAELPLVARGDQIAEKTQ
jgi:hypothetical protein